MTTPDIISPNTTALLRDMSLKYNAALTAPPLQLSGIDGFVKVYNNEPTEDFLTCITPNMMGRIVNGRRVPIRLHSLSIRADDSEGNWLETVSVELGEGDEPAVLIGPVRHGPGEANWSYGLMRAASETEGHELILDLYEAIKQSTRRRSRFLPWSR